MTVMEMRTSNGGTGKNVADAVEYIRFCLKKNVGHNWRWALMAPEPESLVPVFKSMLAEEFPELTVQTVDLNKCPDCHSIRSTLNAAASGIGARMLMIEGLESKDEDTLNCGLGHFISGLDDVQHLSYPEYTYERQGLSILVVLTEGTHSHFVKYSLSGSFAVL